MINPTLHWFLHVPDVTDRARWPWWECLFGGARVNVQAFCPHEAREAAARLLSCDPRQVAIETVRCEPSRRKKRPRRGGKPKAETIGQLSFTIIQDDSEEPEQF